jgi:FecR protein/Putative zinc-finger
MFSNHVTKDLSAYCQGELSNAESRQIAEHLISCSKCRTKLEEIKLGIRLAELLPQHSAPDYLWTELEPLIGKKSTALRLAPPLKPFVAIWQTQFVAIAAVLVVVTTFGIFWIYRNRPASQAPASWEVARIDGTPRIGSAGISNKGQLAVGQWLETDGNSRAKIAVESIGQVEIDPNTRVRLLQTQPTEHRLELAHGKMSARIWAPPRLFFVDTPSAVAADLGCAYTLEVDDAGASLLRVTSGWVALQLKDRESMVPAGAACRTRRGIGPGTPYFEDASERFRQALTQLDFEQNATSASGTAALDVLLGESRVRDTLTLWHLLARVEGKDRIRVYEKVAGFVPPPVGVTREGILQLDQQMLQLWRDKLEASWSSELLVPKPVAEAYWKLKNGATRRALKPGN